MQNSCLNWVIAASFGSSDGGRICSMVTSFKLTLSRLTKCKSIWAEMPIFWAGLHPDWACYYAREPGTQHQDQHPTLKYFHLIFMLNYSDGKKMLASSGCRFSWLACRRAQQNGNKINENISGLLRPRKYHPVRIFLFISDVIFKFSSFSSVGLGNVILFTSANQRIWSIFLSSFSLLLEFLKWRQTCWWMWGSVCRLIDTN